MNLFTFQYSSCQIASIKWSVKWGHGGAGNRTHRCRRSEAEPSEDPSVEVGLKPESEHVHWDRSACNTGAGERVNTEKGG